MERIHAELRITISEHAEDVRKMGMIECSMKGCVGCLQAGLTNLLLRHEGFKEIVKKAVHAANEIKARTDN
ncbi:MAG TPA: hypothetical protein VKR32_10275 [Puia sp.]|nr:hypothetical protein [Puia sp.]